MAAIPEPQHALATAIYGLHAARRAAETPRKYLGWSEIGEECARRVWLGWRWAAFEQIDGRIARLFDTGTREELRVLDELRALGLTVWATGADGKQFEVVSQRGHLKGHLDAVVLGLPEAPKTPHLIDVKTINAKRMAELQKKGMRATYPKYWAQAHGYMGHAQLERAAFIFVCKDNDTIHVERFEFDATAFQRYEERAKFLIETPDSPERIGDAECLSCKFCHFASQCHSTAAPLPNCRTCAHSTPVDGGKWRCEFHGVELSAKTQLEGCKDHRYIPSLLSSFAELVDYNSVSNVAVWRNKLTDAQFSQPRYTSLEIHQAEDKRALGAMFVEAVKDEFGISARVGWKDFPDDLPWATDAKPLPSIEHEQLGELYRS